MARPVEKIEEEILSLPEDDRARLIDSLLASLPDAGEIDEAWMSEIERRRREIAEGKAELIDNDEVFEQVRARLR